MAENLTWFFFSSDVTKLIARRACHVSQYIEGNGGLVEFRYSIDSCITSCSKFALDPRDVPL